MSESTSVSPGSNEDNNSCSRTRGFVRQAVTDEQIHVLHVDDSRAFLDSASERLEEYNDSMAVHTELRAEDAIAHMKTNQVDCIISDYNKAETSGLEFLETVRENHPNLPFILFTAKSAADVASEAIAKGATDHLRKEPETAQYELLANRIENAVSRYRAEQRAKILESQCVELGVETSNILFTFTADMNDVIFVNSAFEELYGIPVDDLYEDPQCILGATHPDDRPHVEQAINRLQDGKQIEIEHRVNEHDEYQRWARLQAKPVCIDDDEVVQIVSIITEITERKERTQESEMLWQAIEKAESPIVLAEPEDDDNPLVYVNEAFEEMTGYTTTEAIGRDCRFLQGENTQAEPVDELRKALENKESVTVELRNYRKDGTEFWNKLTIDPVYDSNGNLVRYLGTQEDITERKEREQRLRQFKQAVESSGRPFYFTDRDGVIEYVNPAFEETTGYSAEEVIGSTPELLQSGEHDQSFYENLWESLLDGETWRGELINQRKNGEQFVVDQTIAPVTDESGKIAHFVASCNEITERKERENKRKQVIDRMNGGVFELDADWKCTLLSEQAATMLGRSRSELLGCDFWDVFSVAQGATSEEQYRKVMATREPVSFVEYYDGLDGWFNVKVDPNDDGGIAVYFREVTELNKREHHLKLLDRVLRHNLRNNINVIRGRAELIENRTKNQVSEMAQQIVETSNNLISLAEKERKLVEVLQEGPEFKEVTVGTLLNTCVSAVDDEHPDATLSVDCPDETTITVCRKFDMAIKELLTNAVVHSNADSPEVAITVRSTSESVTIEIADDGPPIPDMEQSVLLQDNEQTPLYHGSGLGLSLVRMLTARSDGKIYVNRILQEGNIVELELPV